MLVNLQYLLDLSDNSIDGVIPSQLGGLSMLEALNLSHNALDGSIPSSSESMTGLPFTDVSYNELEWSVPHTRLFVGVSLAQLVGGVDVQTQHLGSNPHGGKFRFLFILED